ncbi:hypothetical protein VTL71DRAFT_16226, partial [Oculimacula yallundae]
MLFASAQQPVASSHIKPLSPLPPLDFIGQQPHEEGRAPLNAFQKRKILYLYLQYPFSLSAVRETRP